MSLKRIITESISPFDEEDVEQWISGECIPFTVALVDIFPHYKIAVLNDIKDDGFNFVHAFCYLPNNTKTIIDAVGIRPLRDLYDYFHDINPEIDWDIPNQKYLIDEYAGKEFYDEESYEYTQQDYEEAKEHILKFKKYYES